MSTDAELELQIDAAYERLIFSESEAASTLHWNAMIVLMRQRSPEQLMEMEIERRIGKRYAPLMTHEFELGY
jgi:hypothetical protein